MIRFLSPEPAVAPPVATSVRSLRTLEGATLGLIEVPFTNTPEFLAEIARVLREEHGVKEVVLRSKTEVYAPAPAAVLDELAATCDLVFSAYGH